MARGPGLLRTLRARLHRAAERPGHGRRRTGRRGRFPPPQGRPAWPRFRPPQGTGRSEARRQRAARRSEPPAPEPLQRLSSRPSPTTAWVSSPCDATVTSVTATPGGEPCENHLRNSVVLVSPPGATAASFSVAGASAATPGTGACAASRGCTRNTSTPARRRPSSSARPRSSRAPRTPAAVAVHGPGRPARPAPPATAGTAGPPYRCRQARASAMKSSVPASAAPTAVERLVEGDVHAVRECRDLVERAAEVGHALPQPGAVEVDHGVPLTRRLRHIDQLVPRGAGRSPPPAAAVRASGPRTAPRGLAPPPRSAAAAPSSDVPSAARSPPSRRRARAFPGGPGMQRDRPFARPPRPAPQRDLLGHRPGREEHRLGEPEQPATRRSSSATTPLPYTSVQSSRS